MAWLSLMRPGRRFSIEEKPAQPRSQLRRARHLFLRSPGGADLAANLKPSPRGELEITDLNQLYLERRQLHVEVMGRGVAWLDAGTHESLLQAANFVQAVEERQGMMISCPEEIAYRMGYIGKDELRRLAERLKGNQYGDYLRRLVDGDMPYNPGS